MRNRVNNMGMVNSIVSFFVLLRIAPSQVCLFRKVLLLHTYFHFIYPHKTPVVVSAYEVMKTGESRGVKPSCQGKEQESQLTACAVPRFIIELLARSNYHSYVKVEL